MILYQYQCRECGNTTDQYFNMDDVHPDLQCGKCGGVSGQVIGIPGPNVASESPAWIKSIREVVNKEGGQHCQEFLKDPTRDNYRKWMKTEGIRHIEAGEKPGRPATTPSAEVITDKLMRHRQAKRALCIGGR